MTRQLLILKICKNAKLVTDGAVIQENKDALIVMVLENLASNLMQKKNS